MDCSTTIGVEHLEAAWAFWQYAADSVEYVFGIVEDEIATKLLAALVEAGDDGLDGKQQHAVFANHQTAKCLRDARTALEARGLIVTADQPTNGPPRFRSFALRTSERAK
jgi:hypothetical protein